MHQPVRMAAVILAALLTLCASTPASAASIETRPAWIDGTHILERAFADAIARFAAHPDAHRRTRKALRGVPVGQSETFWAMDVTHNQPYQTQAVLKKIGKSCYIYLEEGRTLSDETINKLAQQFDEKIYPTDRNWFGAEPCPGIDGDQRITLLLLDIRDGWVPGKGYVAGYFFPLDTLSSSLYPQSNEREMFYLDVSPGDPTRPDYLGVLAHEFQHMIHFNNDRREAKFVNEGMSQIAFYACGYGHPSQIFLYSRSTDFSLDNFQNVLENYGEVYLFFYYLLTHYVGNSDDGFQTFTNGLVANPKTGLDGIADQLAKIGVTKPLTEIFSDWATANGASDPSIEQGRFGYDATLKVAVNNVSQTYSLDNLPTEAAKAEVNPWAADYIFYAPEIVNTPLRPTMIDKVTIAAAKPGKLVWNVNEGVLPPAKLIPEGSTVDDATKTVSTPLTQVDGGKFSTVIGSFVRLGLQIETLRFHFAYDDGSQSAQKTVPIFSLPALVKGKDVLRGDKLTFTFTGNKSMPTVLRAVVRRTDGTTTVSDVALDAENKGTYTLANVPTDLDSLTMVVIALGGKKKAEYSYTMVRTPARDLHRFRVYDGINAGPTGKITGGVLSHFSPAVAEKSRSDDEDTSHDNLGYFLNKKQEVIHGLTHLMIDPGLIEGVLFKLWRLLEIVQGFPHLPLPDGLAIVDFDDKAAQDLVTAWAREFNIPVIGLPNTPAPVRRGEPAEGGRAGSRDGSPWVDMRPGSAGRRPGEDIGKVKEVAKRLVLAERIVEFSYNNGLTLANDFSTTLYYFARFIFSSTSTLDTIFKHFVSLPVVGPIAAKLKKVIIGKLIRVGDNLVILLSTKLRPPYSTIVPIAYTVLEYVISRTLDIPLDPSQSGGYTVEFIIGTFGKYVLASVPKIGYVARGQVAVDRAAELAGQLIALGSYADAKSKVWGDEANPTGTSIREKVAQEISDRHEKAWKEQHVAWITSKLAEIAKLVSVIDPTSISKVVAIVLQITTAAIFAHAGYITVSYFFRLPRGDALTGVNLAYDPRYVPQAELAPALTVATPDRSGILHLNQDLDEAFAEYLAEAQKIAEEPKARASFDKLLALDEQLDRLTSRAQALVHGSAPAQLTAAAAKRRDEIVDPLYADSQVCLVQRCALLGDLFARCAGGTTGIKLSSAYKPAFDRYLKTVHEGLGRVLTQTDSSAPVFVADSKVSRHGSTYTVMATIANGAASAVRDVTVDLYSGLSMDVQGGTKRIVGTIPAGGEKSLTWKITLTETRVLPLPTVTIVVDAPGVNGLSKMQVLDQ